MEGSTCAHEGEHTCAPQHGVRPIVLGCTLHTCPPLRAHVSSPPCTRVLSSVCTCTPLHACLHTCAHTLCAHLSTYAPLHVRVRTVRTCGPVHARMRTCAPLHARVHTCAPLHAHMCSPPC
ncbi:hypothetical protein XELAEV_18000778mg [Xenopus laevis]|uniref:Type I interferon 3 n=1 Tax=Xenopus laevis TaxID=8355 RepID=A0A1B1FFT2_XENLA|nr:interferon-like LOC124629380 [Xenopus laevis]ANQ43315.1 type I interferon 3 [Xenopus laevis]OCT59357.1 hypothetical protein XELAEV_18000778mg [Xenopus laevis]